jgi:YesN/AraC family two-component response regulator
MILSGFTLEETCEKLDYTSPSFLRRQMKKFLGKTPREIKAQEKML